MEQRCCASDVSIATFRNRRLPTIGKALNWRITKKGDAMLSNEDRADLVEEIQKSTAGMTDAQRSRVLACWQFMADELRRILHVSQPEQPHQQPLSQGR